MTLWRCPHCATPQPEASRCWVCKRSSTSCGTCRHFRRSVAVQLGYCGLDRRRLPLVGDEIRPCWEADPPMLEADGADIERTAEPVPRTFDFVSLDESLPAVGVVAAAPTATLWGDATDS